jgi:hypothetical protein
MAKERLNLNFCLYFCLKHDNIQVTMHVHVNNGRLHSWIGFFFIFFPCINFPCTESEKGPFFF